MKMNSEIKTSQMSQMTERTAARWSTAARQVKCVCCAAGAAAGAAAAAESQQDVGWGRVSLFLQRLGKNADSRSLSLAHCDLTATDLLELGASGLLRWVLPISCSHHTSQTLYFKPDHKRALQGSPGVPGLFTQSSSDPEFKSAPQRRCCSFSLSWATWTSPGTS